MRNLFATFTATLMVSLIPLIVRGQDYSDREGKLLRSPDKFQCDSDGFYADPNDCTVFYRCIDWGESSENSLQPRYTSFKFQCGESTVFDIESNNCVHVEETTRTECRQYAEPYMFARISERDAGDGQDYGVVQQSSSGYNQPSQQTSYNQPGTDSQMPGDSGDIDNNIGESSSQSHSKSPPCEADGFFPIQNDCTHFYRCVGNGNGFNKYEFSCGPGTVWDPDNNACNHRWAVSRTDCRAEESGPEGGPETSEGPESPEVAEQVAEPSSTTAVPTSTTSSTTVRPYQTPPSRPSQSTQKPTTTASRPTASQSSAGRPTTSQPTTSQSTTDGSTSTTQASTSSVAPSETSNENGTKPGNSCESEGFFPDEKDCKKFYRCVDQGNGKYTKYEFECAEGTVWDVQETTCNYDYAVQQSNCNSSSSESQTSTTSGESSSSSSDNTSASTASTSSYNNSSSSTTSQQSSSSTSTASQQTSSASQTTSSTSQATSSSSQTSSSSSQTTSSSSQTTSSSSQTTSSQQTSSSSSNNSSQSTSSAQQTTNSQQSTASSSNQSNATSGSTTSNGSSTNGSQSKDDKCTEEGFFPSSKSCNKFYRCVSNEGSGFTKYEFNCGPGTVWDPDNNVCNHPWAVRDEKCRSGGQGTTPMGESQSSESTTSSSSTESSVQTSTSSRSNGTTTAASTSTTSSQTSTTINSNVTTTEAANITDSTEAASTTVSNQTISTTESTTDSNTTTTESGCTNSTTNKPSSSKIKCEKAGYYPNPDDCKKFYRCVDWDGDKGERFSVYHFNCPEGTIFDPSLNVCNHEESVYPPRNCNGSGSQTTDSTPTSSPTGDNATTTEPSTSTETSTSNSTEVTETTSEATTIQPTTDTSNATETTTMGSSETTPAATTVVTTSTSEKVTETTNPATSTTPESTTALTTPSSQQTTTQPTTTEISTTTSPSSETCPEIGPDQFRLVCPTGFRRHPKYCNLFYQCTVSKTMDIKIVTLSCTNGTIYDEKKIQCLPPEEAKKCEGSMMTDARNLKNLDDNSVSPITVKSEKSICPNEGSFTYKEDCRLFYKCKKDDQGKLMGYLYQCPEGFAYWSVSKRCEKTEKVPCENKKASSISPKFSLAPIETKNVGF